MKPDTNKSDAPVSVPYDELKSVVYEGKEYRLFDLDFLGTRYKIFFKTEKYLYGGFAVMVMSINRKTYDGKLDEECIDIFTVATKNLEPLDENSNHAYADGNSSWLVQFIKKHRLAKDTGYWFRSRFVTYPLMEWFPEKFLVRKRTRAKRS